MQIVTLDCINEGWAHGRNDTAVLRAASAARGNKEGKTQGCHWQWARACSITTGENEEAERGIKSRIGLSKLRSESKTTLS